MPIVNEAKGLPLSSTTEPVMRPGLGISRRFFPPAASVTGGEAP
jgi:hypothetical protein